MWLSSRTTFKQLLKRVVSALLNGMEYRGFAANML